MGDAAEVFDAASMAPATDTVEFEVFNPITKTGTNFWITVYGRDSDTHKKVTRAQQDRRFKQMGRRMSVTLTADELDAEQLETLAACTKSWRTGEDAFIKLKGRELECNPENARALYTAVPTIREQVEDAVSDRGNFLKR